MSTNFKTELNRLCDEARAEWRELPSREFDLFVEAHGHHRAPADPHEVDAPLSGYWTAASWRARMRRLADQALRAINAIERATARGHRSPAAAARLQRAAASLRRATGCRAEASLALLDIPAAASSR